MLLIIYNSILSITDELSKVNGQLVQWSRQGSPVMHAASNGMTVLVDELPRLKSMASVEESV